MALRFLLSLGDRYAPVLRSSKFKEEGKLTPDEFVVAGEQLVHTCGTWVWEGGDSSRARDYLPEGKQYLITRNVPCRQRARDQADVSEEKLVEGEGEDAWTVTHSNQQTQHEDEVPEAPVVATAAAVASLSLAGPAAAAAAPAAAPGRAGAPGAIVADADDDDDDSDVPDADEYLRSLAAGGGAGTAVVADDAAAVAAPGRAAAGDTGVERHRTYDVSITYDNWYKTPRVFLVGYSEHGAALSAAEMMEDISVEHAEKTVTFEAHPHTGVMAVSVHPCRHAQVMKSFIDAYEQEGKPVRVDQYLFLFLKIVAAAVPTIDYDFTVELDSVRTDS